MSVPKQGEISLQYPITEPAVGCFCAKQTVLSTLEKLLPGLGKLREVSDQGRVV